MANCPKDRLLNIVTDVELISKELFEYFLAPKHVRQSLIDGNHLAELLVKKDQELKEELENAQDQELIQSKIEILRTEVDKYDVELRQLQKDLKEAEHILATGIFQAKQKLSLIQKANSHPISSEELIKYAHKISADHSVASPYNWEIGDQRRPYPTDLEMKSGLLANSNDANLSSLLQQQQNQYVQQNQQMQPEQALVRPSSNSASGSPYPWANQYDDIKPNVNSLNASFDHHVDMKSSSNAKDNDDVEVMSTDSSSSSSSDSQ
ncbi:Mediator of RNA polymerase II transcription subunit 4 [Tyrophagus putrescentiae]|nr:Mediator of RNA polymerase II transcription subunit 4 [Tyrophagus putrescentiae]